MPTSAGRLMGTFAEDCARNYQFTREEQDEFAITSLERAQKAIKDGASPREIAPVTVESAQRRDRRLQRRAAVQGRLDKIPTLKPAFAKDGTVTAANSSSISDGAAALVLMRAARPTAAASQRSPASSAHAAHAASASGSPPRRSARSRS